MDTEGSPIEASKIIPSDEVNWDVVDKIMRGYAKRRPFELEGCAQYVAKLRKNTVTKFGELGTDSNMRHVYELPSALKLALEIKYPLVLKGRNLKKFLAFYPDFQVAEKL